MQWWEPNQLKRVDAEFRNKSTIDECDPHNDFGSYRRLLLGDSLESSQIAEHNDISPEIKITLIKRCLHLDNIKSILDVGCGVGYTANALGKIFQGANVSGIDVSSDAIEYARAKFPMIDFQARAASPDEKMFGLFDAVFCFEFYPFTRNSNPEFQASMIKWLMQMVSNHGALIIYQKWNQPHTLSAVWCEVVELCRSELDLTVTKLPHPKFPVWLPLFLGYTLSAVACILRREGFRHAVQVRWLKK
jgi:2-polyprenyl-3-methyl-5-hydroxy-6-metoxy-1,4-benzoquinol methylase